MKNPCGRSLLSPVAKQAMGQMLHSAIISVLPAI
jgi:hypothetical protein